MKKIFTYITMVMMMMTMFTSCEPVEYWGPGTSSAAVEDRNEAYTLHGTWTGYIKAYYYDRWGVTGDHYRTTMYFERENAYGGWGYEVDYDLNSRYEDYYYCKFVWDIYKGSIRIRYADSWNDVYIEDYRLSSNYFEGYMDDGTTSDIYFRLAYDGAFDWGYWTRGFTRGDSDASDVKASGVFALNAKSE